MAMLESKGQLKDRKTEQKRHDKKAVAKRLLVYHGEVAKRLFSVAKNFAAAKTPFTAAN